MKRILTLMWIVGAASAYDGQSGVAGGLNPCSLLSSAEISAAAGVAVHEGTLLFRDGATTGCSFARPEGGRIALFVRLLPTGAWATEQVDRMRRGVRSGSYREMSGVGEQSFLLDRKAAAALCVFQRPYYLQIAALGVGDRPRSPAALEKLARTALQRLAGLGLTMVAERGRPE